MKELLYDYNQAICELHNTNDRVLSEIMYEKVMYIEQNILQIVIEKASETSKHQLTELIDDLIHLFFQVKRLINVDLFISYLNTRLIHSTPV